MPLSRPEGRPETALVRRVFIGLLVANLMVVAAKFFVGLRSGSLAILGSALDSSVDALNNVLALIVVRVAAKEPDEDHPYGHGKFETLGALGIVGFLSITCFELVRGAVNELLQGEDVVQRVHGRVQGAAEDGERAGAQAHEKLGRHDRSEERRVGKEGRS